MTITALLTFPIVCAACQGLSDRGLSIARPAGIALAVLPVWWIGNIAPLPFNNYTVAGSALAIGAIGWGFVVQRLEVGALLRTHWFRLAAIEFASGALFFGYVLLRGFNPDVRGTEKPMELAFLNASIKSDVLPVGDPWFVGEPINYYYFGYALYGALGRLSGIPGDSVFNLALAITFSMAVVAAGGLAANLVDRMAPKWEWASGAGAMLAGFLLMFSGNLHTIRQLVQSPAETLSAGWWDGPGRGATRVITDAGVYGSGERTVVSEFPAFSWILGDLQPHVLAYPWLLTAFALTVSLVFVLRFETSFPGTIFHSIPLGIFIGILYAANTWDVPVVALMTFVALFIISRHIGWSTPVVSGISVVLTALLAAVPFAVNYTAASGNPVQVTDHWLHWMPLIDVVAGNVGVVDWDQSSFGELLTVHGGFLALLAVVVIGGLLRLSARSWLLAAPVIMAAAVFLVVSIWILETSALIVIGVPILALLLILSGDPDPGAARGFSILAMIAALLVAILTEFYFIQEPFGGRGNTVFHFYFQIWAILAVGTGALLSVSVGSIRDKAPVIGRWLAIGGITGILVASSIYTPLSAYRWFNEFSTWHGLSGLGYLEQVNRHEAAAIRWLQEAAGPDAVVVEAPGCSYGMDNGTPHSRISMGTGIPTIIGWEGHQFQWRRQQPRLLSEIDERQSRVATIYERPLESEAPRYLSMYDVTHIVTGVHEMLGYSNCDVGPPYIDDELQDLRYTIWQPVFRSGPVRILAPHPEGYVAN